MVQQIGSAAGAAPFDSEQAAPLAIADIQTRLDALAVAMCTKALKNPDAEYAIRSSCACQLTLRWDSKDKYLGQYHFIEGSPAAALSEAEAYVAALPSPEQTRLREFLESLDETIQLGKKADIEVEAINPMLDILKRISKNAITHRAAE